LKLRSGLTIEGIHQGVAGDCGASTTGRSSQRVVNASLVTTHEVLDSLIGSEIDSMRRA